MIKMKISTIIKLMEIARTISPGQRDRHLLQGPSPVSPTVKVSKTLAASFGRPGSQKATSSPLLPPLFSRSLLPCFPVLPSLCSPLVGFRSASRLRFLREGKGWCVKWRAARARGRGSGGVGAPSGSSPDAWARERPFGQPAGRVLSCGPREGGQKSRSFGNLNFMRFYFFLLSWPWFLSLFRRSDQLDFHP